jgi:hypothetical protein
LSVRIQRSCWWERPWWYTTTLVDGLALLPWVQLRVKALLPLPGCSLSRLTQGARLLEQELSDPTLFEKKLRETAQPSLGWLETLGPQVKAWAGGREQNLKEWTFVFLDGGAAIGVISFEVKFTDILKLPKKKIFVCTPFHYMEIPDINYQVLPTVEEDRFVDLVEILSLEGVHVVARSKFKKSLKPIRCKKTFVLGGEDEGNRDPT